MDLIKHPLSEDFGEDFPVVQYADDPLLILPASATTLFNLKGLLRSFSDSSGLHVNFSKSFLVPVNVSEEKGSHLVQTFGCDVGSMPFTYLGLPLGTTKPSILDFSPLVTKIERRLSGETDCGKLSFLSSAYILYVLSSVASNSDQSNR